MRWIAALALIAVHTTAAAEAQVQAAQPVCSAPALLGDIRNVSCGLVATGSTQRFRFRVTFLGGHDDTKAAIEPSLDGKAMTCDPGSKTSLFGEDGEVSLDCRFSMARDAGTRHAFEVAVLWSHAQYKDFAFAAE